MASSPAMSNHQRFLASRERAAVEPGAAAALGLPKTVKRCERYDNAAGLKE
jgi:hypothetical protein